MIAQPALLQALHFRGGPKADRALVADLIGRGHDVHLLAVSATETDGQAERLVASWRSLLSRRYDESRAGTLTISSTRFDAEGKEPSGARRAWIALRYMALLGRVVRSWSPDWVVWNQELGSEDLVAAIAGNRLILRFQTPATLPFGPHTTQQRWTRRLRWAYRRAAGIFVVSRFMQRYVREHSGLETEVQMPFGYGQPPFARLGRFADGVVTLINPYPFKGVAIFTALAKRFPQHRFRAVGLLDPYGHPNPDIASLRAMPNVEVVEAKPDVGDVLAGSTALLAPSMWGEGFGMVVIDAMLRGIPALVSDDGGLPEAALSTGVVLPVQPGAYVHQRDGVFGRRLRRFVVPEQQIGPWADALQHLFEDETYYTELSARSHAVANEFVSGLSAAPMEAFGESRHLESSGQRSRRFAR